MKVTLIGKDGRLHESMGSLTRLPDLPAQDFELPEGARIKIEEWFPHKGQDVAIAFERRNNEDSSKYGQLEGTATLTNEAMASGARGNIHLAITANNMAVAYDLLESAQQKLGIAPVDEHKFQQAQKLLQKVLDQQIRLAVIREGYRRTSSLSTLTTSLANLVDQLVKESKFSNRALTLDRIKEKVDYVGKYFEEQDTEAKVAFEAVRAEAMIPFEDVAELFAQLPRVEGTESARQAYQTVEDLIDKTMDAYEGTTLEKKAAALDAVEKFVLGQLQQWHFTSQANGYNHVANLFRLLRQEPSSEETQHLVVTTRHSDSEQPSAEEQIAEEQGSLETFGEEPKPGERGCSDDQQMVEGLQHEATQARPGMRQRSGLTMGQQQLLKGDLSEVDLLDDAARLSLRQAGVKDIGVLWEFSELSFREALKNPSVRWSEAWIDNQVAAVKQFFKEYMLTWPGTAAGWLYEPDAQS